MISLDIEKNQADNISGFYGLSTDTKPTDSFEGVIIKNGMIFNEIDTSNTYIFNEVSKTWIKQSSGGGGGGGTTYTAGPGIDITNDTISTKLKQDGGIVLDDNELALDPNSIPSELPTVTSQDEGKVLMVDSNGDWEANDVPTELPSVTSSDEGKVLMVDSNGAWIAGELENLDEEEF